jgi:class 3 adenylate cyclase
VDASYLSPNVNMASRLEAATKQFGVQILLSQDFVVRAPQQRRPPPAFFLARVLRARS